MKVTFFFALLALFVAIAQASKCPCTCFTKRRVAVRQCRHHIYSSCHLSSCFSHHRKGLQCCDAAPSVSPSPTASMSMPPTPTPSVSMTPSSSPSYSPTPSMTPSSSPSMSATASPSAAPSVDPSPSPMCPCVCRRGGFGKRKARHECRHTRPYCKVRRCGYRQVQCCNH